MNGRGSRKRKSYPQTWQQNRRKFKRNLGLNYKTKSGKVIPKMNCLRPINKCCVFECYQKFTPESFTKKNTDYWALEILHVKEILLKLMSKNNYMLKSKARWIIKTKIYFPILLTK